MVSFPPVLGEVCNKKQSNLPSSLKKIWVLHLTELLLHLLVDDHLVERPTSHWSFVFGGRELVEFNTPFKNERMEPENLLFEKEHSSSQPSFLGSMLLILRGVGII